MSLLKDLIKEMAAAGSTSAHAVAGARGSLFGGGAVDAKRSERRRRRMMRRAMNMESGEVIRIPHSNKWKNILEDEETKFDPADVISKLDAAEKKAKVDRDTITFGLEDEEGNIIKVYVRADQAEEFESALAGLLAGQDEDEDDENTALEIAEVLFQLKDNFEIVDVEWGVIEGDEEEEQEVEGDADMEGEDMEGMEGEGGEDDLEGIEDDDLGGEDDLEGEMTDDTETAKSALDSVLDMMKSDAEARKAEADAKKAEAEAKIADLSAQAAEAKVKQEEEILDMEAHDKAKAEEEKEAKRLAKLAKYRHEMANEGSGRPSEEEEEDVDDKEPWRLNHEEKEDDNLSLEELSTLIMRHLKSN